jgi:predicted DNA-binding transcriptional regulator YafY
MPKVKDFYQRIEIIDECFRQKGKKWTVENLLETVNEKLRDRLEEGISKRTLQYALDHLINEKQAPVGKETIGREVYYFYEDANYSIKNLALNDEEIILLKDAVDLIKQIGGISIASELVDVITKLENTFAKKEADPKSVIQFEKHSQTTGLEYLHDLLIAVKEKMALNVTYQPFGKEPYVQLIHPYLLKEYRNRWFLIGRNDGYNTVCNLALDRIKSIKPAKNEFQENNLFDADTYFNNMIGVTLPVNAEVQHIIIRVKASLCPYIRTKPIHASQKLEQTLEDGSELFTLSIIENYELRSTLLSYGNDLEVLQPQNLREYMKKIFKYGADMYH